MTCVSGVLLLVKEIACVSHVALACARWLGCLFVLLLHSTLLQLRLHQYTTTAYVSSKLSNRGVVDGKVLCGTIRGV